jgi:hypothetical protein
LSTLRSTIAINQRKLVQVVNTHFLKQLAKPIANVNVKL